MIEITDSQLWGSEPIAPAKSIVDLLDEEPLEVEIATTLLYEHCHHSYRQIRQAVQVAGERRRREIIDLGLRMYATKSGAYRSLRPYCRTECLSMIRLKLRVPPCECRPWSQRRQEQTVRFLR